MWCSSNSAVSSYEISEVVGMKLTILENWSTTTRIAFMALSLEMPVIKSTEIDSQTLHGAGSGSSSLRVFDCEGFVSWQSWEFLTYH